MIVMKNEGDNDEILKIGKIKIEKIKIYMEEIMKRLNISKK